MKFIHTSAICAISVWASGSLADVNAAQTDTDVQSATSAQPINRSEVDNPIRAAREDDAEILFAIQTALSALGLYTSAIDGQWGPGSRRAMSRFRDNEGLPFDGEFSDLDLDILEQRFDQLTVHGSVWAALDCPGPGCPSQPYSELSAPRPNLVAAARPPAPIRESYEVAQLPLQPLQPPISATPSRTINRNTGGGVFRRVDEARLSIDVADQLELSVARIHSGTVVAVQCALADLGFLSRQEMNAEVDGVFLLAAFHFAQSHGLEFERGNPLEVEFLSELASEYSKLGRSQNCGRVAVKRNIGTGIFR